MKKAILFTFLMFGAASCCGGQKAPAATTPEVTAEAGETPGTEAPQKEPLCGAYGNSRALTPEEVELFKTATADLDGVAYIPESVSTQVVAGTNYKFLCAAKTITLHPKHYKAEVIVFAPLPHTKEQPKITRITNISE